MKGSSSCALVASFIAASTVALSDVTFTLGSNQGRTKKNLGEKASHSQEKDKFAPRFDGLRFIETLVTAHR